jgi:hypothetical protein
MEEEEKIPNVVSENQLQNEVEAAGTSSGKCFIFQFYFTSMLYYYINPKL